MFLSFVSFLIFETPSHLSAEAYMFERRTRTPPWWRHRCTEQSTISSPNRTSPCMRRPRYMNMDVGSSLSSPSLLPLSSQLLFPKDPQDKHNDGFVAQWHTYYSCSRIFSTLNPTFPSGYKPSWYIHT